jgi:hypothetical protein
MCTCPIAASHITFSSELSHTFLHSPAIIPLMPLTFCDLCGKEIAPHGHYIVRVDVFADPSMPPTTSAELEAADLDGEIDELLEQMKDMTADEIQDQVHRRFEFRICAKCQPSVLANPLGRRRGIRVQEN